MKDPPFRPTVGTVPSHEPAREPPDGDRQVPSPPDAVDSEGAAAVVALRLEPCASPCPAPAWPPAHRVRVESPGEECWVSRACGEVESLRPGGWFSQKRRPKTSKAAPDGGDFGGLSGFGLKIHIL